jgi:hypothetical protein
MIGGASAGIFMARQKHISAISRQSAFVVYRLPPHQTKKMKKISH